jgi:hypothetical protein
MEQQFSGKSVPWPQMEEYLNLFRRKVHPYLTLKDSGEMNLQEVEAKLPRPLFELHALITKILKDNSILTNEEDFKLNQL